MLKKNVRLQFLREDVFLPIRNALDNTMKTLQSKGLGHNPRKAEVISPLMEEELWSGGYLGDQSSQHLLSTLVYLLGVNLALRSGEHRKLRREMFQVIKDAKTKKIRFIQYKVLFHFVICIRCLRMTNFSLTLSGVANVILVGFVILRKSRRL
jgi:hypothetical protein